MVASGAMVVCNFLCVDVLFIGQGLTMLDVDAGRANMDFFSLVHRFLFFLSLSGRWPDID